MILSNVEGIQLFCKNKEIGSECVIVPPYIILISVVYGDDIDKENFSW